MEDVEEAEGDDTITMLGTAPAIVICVDLGDKPSLEGFLCCFGQFSTRHSEPLPHFLSFISIGQSKTIRNRKASHSVKVKDLSALNRLKMGVAMDSRVTRLGCRKAQPCVLQNPSVVNHLHIVECGAWRSGHSLGEQKPCWKIFVHAWCPPLWPSTSPEEEVLLAPKVMESWSIVPVDRLEAFETPLSRVGAVWERGLMPSE
jgi:hypothetical protein